MRTASPSLAFVPASTGLANSQAQRVSPEEAEEQGLSTSTLAVQSEGGVNACPGAALYSAGAVPAPGIESHRG